MSNDPETPARDPLVPVVGAVIFASDEPVRPAEIAEALGDVESADVEKAIRELEAHCNRHDIGLRLEWIAGGVQMATSSGVAESVRRFFRQRNKTRLSAAALETLAIVAYRQPATVPEIQAIRGKDPAAAIRGLLDKKLVRCVGRKKVVGSPMLYGTSREFLVHFGLNSLEDLPAIEDFEHFVEVLEARQPDIAPSEADGTLEQRGDA
jgi:segregation and condensation protein B